MKTREKVIRVGTIAACMLIIFSHSACGQTVPLRVYVMFFERLKLKTIRSAVGGEIRSTKSEILNKLEI
jgi:hypothetical protein